MNPTHQSEPPPATAETASHGPGERLRAAREAAGLSLSQVSARLRLDTRTLEALESGSYGSLPAPTFVRGYLRSYARLLDLEPEPIVDAFDRCGLAPPPLVADIAQPGQARSGDVPVRVVTYLVIIGLVVLVALWWQSREQEAPLGEPLAALGERAGEVLAEGTPPAPAPPGEAGPGEAPATERPESTAATAAEGAAAPGQPARAAARQAAALEPSPAATVPAAGAPEAEVASAAPPHAEGAGAEAIPAGAPGASPGAPAAGGEPAPAEPAGAAPAAPATAPAEAPEPPAEIASAEPATAPGEPPATAAQGTLDRLRLSFTNESWVEVYDAGGERLYFNLAREGSVLDLEGRAPFRVVLGYARGVEVRFNDVPFDPAPFVSRGIARFTLGGPRRPSGPEELLATPTG